MKKSSQPTWDDAGEYRPPEGWQLAEEACGNEKYHQKAHLKRNNSENHHICCAFDFSLCKYDHSSCSDTKNGKDIEVPVSKKISEEKINRKLLYL